jgi:hypothetical protein
MKTVMNITLSLFTLLTLGVMEVQGKEILVVPESGDSFVVDVDPDASYPETMEEIHAYLIGINEADPQDEVSLSYMMGLPVVAVNKASKKGGRNYGSPVTSAEKKEIRYIITSLAKYNWIQLAKEESSLKKAGDKINNVHPFRFLQCIFTDEELKSAIYVVRNKSLVWSDYFNGLKKSMNEEFDVNNLIQFTPDFANNVGVNVNSILPSVQSRQWAALVDTLINTIPRQGNPSRYDM